MLKSDRSDFQSLALQSSLDTQPVGLGWDNGAPLALNPNAVKMFAIGSSDDGGQQ
jgi:hypothetical protein